MELDVVKIIVTAFVTGVVSTVTTVRALRIHIEYLKEGLARAEKAIAHAHARIDAINKKS